MLPPTVHWIELLSAFISGTGALFLLWVALDAHADLRAIPRDRPDLKPLASYALIAAHAKGIAQTIFFLVSVRAMTLPPATINPDRTPDLGAVASVAGLIFIEILLTALGIENVQMRRAVRRAARTPYLGPDRRQHP